MANIKSQKKRVLTNEKRRQRNQAIRSAVRTEIRKFREAVASGDKAVTKGVFHRNNGANKKSKMANAFNKMS